MQIAHTLAELHTQLQPFAHPSVVPTMGGLHDGHLALVSEAKRYGDVTVATIFVNRLQFAPHEDFDSYPRTLAADCSQLEAAGCDIVFAPTEAELYPDAATFTITPPAVLADTLEGQFRPGFFTGVCTVVTKLLNCTRARTAVFGKKDYQQLMVIEQMVRQLNMPVQIVGMQTQRASDGLALSSRNTYLSAPERTQASLLWQTLNGMADALRSGLSDYASLEADAMQTLRQAGWQPDYMAVRRRSDLQNPSAVGAGAASEALVVLGAARLGGTRLIDNVEV